MYAYVVHCIVESWCIDGIDVYWNDKLAFNLKAFGNQDRAETYIGVLSEISIPGDVITLRDDPDHKPIDGGRFCIGQSRNYDEEETVRYKYNVLFGINRLKIE